MADIQQGVRHQSARDAAGTVDTYNGDLRALFNAVATVPAGSTFNEAFMLWLQSVTGSSADNINDLAAIYASQQDDTYNWSSVGSLALPTLLTWNPESGEVLPASLAFVRASTAWYRNDSGLWVQAGSGVIRGSHNATIGGGAKGYLPEANTTKISKRKRELSNVIWSATNITPVRDAVGIDGVANAASTLTATAANGTIFQPVTSASAAHTHQAFVARKTGTGTVEMTIDGGSTWVDITSSLTSNIDNPFRVTQTLANPSIGFRIVTSGDEIEVDCSELEALSFGTSPMVVNDDSNQVRAADSLITNGVSLGTAYTLFADATWPYKVVDGTSLFSKNSSNFNRIDVQASTFIRNNYFEDSINIFSQSAPGAGTRAKVASRWLENDCAMAVTGETTFKDLATAILSGGETEIGQASGGNFRGTMHNIVFYGPGVTDEQLEGLVA